MYEYWDQSAPNWPSDLLLIHFKCTDRDLRECLNLRQTKQRQRSQKPPQTTNIDTMPMNNRSLTLVKVAVHHIDTEVRPLHMSEWLLSE